MQESNRLVRAEPTLSVVMANYNHACYISEALEAILAQSFRPREVIVVDDGSTDNSIAVMEEFVRRDPIVRLLRNERNMGVLFSANRALEHASGDYVYFASADDKVLPGLFEKSMKLLAKYPQAGVCSTLSLKISEKGNDLGMFLPPPPNCKTECYLPPDKVLATLRRYGSWHVGNTAIHRREAFIKAGGFPPELRSYADSFVFQVVALKHGACFIPEPLGILRITENSFSSETGSPEVNLDLTERCVELMRSNYRDSFPEQYVQECWKNFLCSARLVGYTKLKQQHDECLAQIERSFEHLNLVDRLFLSGLKLCMGVQLSSVKLYLFLRLRRFTWFSLVREIGSSLKSILE